MTSNEILNGLEGLFKDKPSILTVRGSNSISFIQMIPNLPRVASGPFMQLDRRYTHTVTLLNGAYRTEDFIETFNAGNDKPRTGLRRGDINERGNYKGRTWDTEDIKSPVRHFMAGTGLEKKKPFWTGKKIAIFFAIIWIPIIIAYLIHFLG